MSKLNPNAQKWVDALRSGKYEQTKHHLRAGNAFCCLGVLCEVAIDNGVAVKSSGNLYDNEDMCLPLSVATWAGMKNSYGFLEDVQKEDPDDVIAESLAVANDDGTTFEQIASMIEKYAEVLGVSA